MVPHIDTLIPGDVMMFQKADPPPPSITLDEGAVASVAVAPKPCVWPTMRVAADGVSVTDWIGMLTDGSPCAAAGAADATIAVATTTTPEHTCPNTRGPRMRQLLLSQEIFEPARDGYRPGSEEGKTDGPIPDAAGCNPLADADPFAPPCDPARIRCERRHENGDVYREEEKRRLTVFPRAALRMFRRS